MLLCGEICWGIAIQNSTFKIYHHLQPTPLIKITVPRCS